MPKLFNTRATGRCAAPLFLTLSYLLLAGFSLPTLAQAKAESKNSLHVDLDLTAKSDDNIGQAEGDDDILDDDIFEPTLSLSYTIPIGIKKGLILSTSLGQQSYQEIDTLDNSKIGVTFNYLWQNTLGYTAPLYSFTLNAEELDSKTDQRDATIVKAMLSANRRFTDTQTLRIGLSHKGRDSEHDVFDLKSTRFFVSGDQLIGENGTFYFTASIAKGEVFSVWRPPSAYSYPGDSVWDQAFNNHFANGNIWRAYQVDADTYTAMAGYNYGLPRGFAVDLSALYVDVSADDTNYQRQILSASLLKRF